MTTLRTALAIAVVVTGVGLGGCTDEGPDRSATTAAPTPAPTGGTAAEPIMVEPGTSLLEWVPAPGSPDNTVTTNGTWFLTVEATGEQYALDGPERSLGTGASDTRKITNAMLNPDWAVVVRQDQQGSQPDVAEVTDLSTGLQFAIDDSTDIPTTAGGTWALGGDELVHATVTPEGRTCVVSVDLIAQKSLLGWCAGDGQGFTSAHVTPGGTTLLTYDDATPACRTVASMDGDVLEPFAGSTPCVGWDSSTLGEGADIWSTVPQDDQTAPAEFYARDGDSYYDLGAGTSGTLVPCGEAAFFVRDPQKADAPAQLVRWQNRTLSVVYEAPPGQSYLEAPRCGDRALVVTALSESGNEQVMAALG